MITRSRKICLHCTSNLLSIVIISRGYAEKEGDARSFHPKLRPPVSLRELEIDSKTGMKVPYYITIFACLQSHVFRRNILQRRIKDGILRLPSFEGPSNPALNTGAERKVMKVPSFGKPTASSELASIPWKIYLPTVIGVSSLFVD